ncbi:hypothetical protein S40288_08336 [Stachybotrys chartarum IBT 40288]|nr:hypothetical protein S40288_08336 [Stachybotrys chartarum IBT 40288]
MLLRLGFLTVLVCLGLVVSCSAGETGRKRSCRINRVRNERFTGRNGKRALEKAYRKYGMPLTRRQPPASSSDNLVARRDTDVPASDLSRKGVVAASPEVDDLEYLSPVSIGGQVVNLAFDTGSSDLWVFSSELDAASRAGHGFYNASASASFAPVDGASFRVAYGDGSAATGIVGTDVVDVGGVAVQAQAVELATAVTRDFVEDQNNDGLLGLGFSALNTVKPQPQRTFFENAMPSLAEPVFTADLRRNATGAFEFGAVDTAKFAGDMTWVPVNTTQGFWQFSSETFAVGDGPPVPATPGSQAIADTGTTLILADAALVQGYYSQVPSAKSDADSDGFIFPCDTAMPDLSLDIGGMYMARIKGDDLKFVSVGEGNCYGALQASAPGHVGIYGDVLFKSQFVAFNGANFSIGLAPHA